MNKLTKFAKIATMGVLILLAFTKDNSLAEVLDSGDSYLVSEIVVSSNKEDKKEAEKELFLKSKIAAFNYLKIYLGRENLNPNSVELDELLLHFEPLKLEFVKGPAGPVYVGYFTITFDKNTANNMLLIEEIKNTNPNRNNEEFFRISLGVSLVTWVKVRNALRTIKANFRIIDMTKDMVEIGISDMEYETIEKKLQEHKCYIIENNNIKFIKLKQV